jgi:hypothetical protein
VDWNYYCHSLFTALKGMAGATGLEPAASAVKGRKQTGSRCNYKAAVALQCPVRNGGERQETGLSCTVLAPRVFATRQPLRGALSVEMQD